MHNGVSVHGLELDDTHPRGGIHLGGAIFAATFAMGERVGASGAEVLVAAILGYEVSARLAMALPLAAHSGHGFHSTGTCNVFGATVACAKLLRLDVAQTVNALGIAGSQSAGSLEYRTEGAWTKRLHPGWAAHCGVVAAELARAGFTGPHRIIEGRAGFLRSYSDAPRAHLVLDGLGSDYEVRRTAIKPHAACRHSQAAIDALSGLASTHALVPSEIERITVRIFQAALASVAEPEARKRRPKTMIDAQFNIFFASAAAILWGGPTLSHYGSETLGSPEVLGLMDRVVCIPDPELSTLFPDVWPAKVEVLLRDGRTLDARVDYPLGDPENPLSWDQLVTKFLDVTEGVVLPDRQREIVRASETFADHPVERFTRLLAAES
jgi:2-methylcitrate dehydratase PrpD